MNGLTPVQVGALGENIVENDLLRIGLVILRPSTPERYDIVADDGSRFYRIQAKVGRWDRRGSAPALKASFDTPYSPTDVDVIAVVDIDAETVYYVKATDVEDSTNVTFRFDNHAGATSAFRASECMRFPYAERSDENE